MSFPLRRQEGARGAGFVSRALTPRNSKDPVKAEQAGASYSVIIGGIWVLITGDDLRSHPVGRAYERISPADRPVKLSAHTKIHWEGERGKESRTRLTDKYSTRPRNVRRRCLQSKQKL